MDKDDQLIYEAHAQSALNIGDIIYPKSDLWYTVSGKEIKGMWVNEDDVKKDSEFAEKMKNTRPQFKKNNKAEVITGIDRTDSVFIANKDSGNIWCVPADFAKENFRTNNADQARSVLRRLR